MNSASGTALVTGGAHRIGRALVLALAGAGYDVAVHYHGSDADAHDTATAARALGVRAQVFQADLLDRDATAALIGQVTARMGRLSVLVNNASIFEDDDIHSATMDSWDRHIGSNLRAPFQLIQGFAAQTAPATRDEGNEPVAPGLIVNMIDQRVMNPGPGFMTYALAKSGLWWLTRTTAQALGPAIRVNAIGPGPTLQGAHQSLADFAAERAATVLNRGADPGDITAALIYLVQARAVTGQMICVDGGQHLGA